MKLLVLTFLLVFLSGCSTLDMKNTKDGRLQMSFVLKEKNGCKDRIGIRGKKLVYNMCF
jgi:uncharacterized protein YceK